MPAKALALRRVVTFGLSAVVVALTPSLSVAQTASLRLPLPTFPEAVEAWTEGRVADALTTLDRELASVDDGHPLEALILRATLLTESGRPEEAETLWRAVIDREVWMRTFARRALVESLVGRGALDEAGSIVAELNRSDATRHLDLTLQLADAYRDSNLTEPARRLYRLIEDRQPRSTLADSARLGIARTLESDGDVQASISLLREAKRRHQSGLAYEAARRAEHRLMETHRLPEAVMSEGDYRTLVRRLRGASRFDASLELIDEWRAAHGEPSGTPDIEAEWIETLYARRSNEEALSASRQFYDRFPSSRLIPDIRLTDFRLAVRMVDTERARRTGLDLWDGRVPGATDDHRWNAGNLLAAHLVAVGDVEGGLDLYRQLFSEAESADRQRELLWRAGIAALRAGDPERARNNLRSLIERGPTGELVPAALYWLARAESQEDDDAATRRMRDIAGRFPYHYYGMRARQELARRPGEEAPDVIPVVAFPELSVATGSTERAEYRAALALARAGRVTDAAWYLRRLLSRQTGDRGLALLAARASADAGEQASVTRILVNYFGPFLQQPASGLPPDFWQLVYPRPFWDDVRRAGERHDVDPLLMLSVMRRESRYDPNARSQVGAVGLFQIMTYTAEALAESAGVGEILEGGVTEASLTVPAVNAAIAARLTARLLDMFDGATAPVVASYNAGEERVAVWWEAAQSLAEDFFVDTIPYSETRRFVREVLANRAAYERVYSE